MDRDKVEELVRLTESDPGAVRSIGSNLGFALAADGMEAAEAYGSAIGAPIDPNTSEDFVRGYLACARDVATSYVVGVNEIGATDPTLLARWAIGKRGALSLLRLAQERGVIRLSDVNRALGSAQEAQWSMLLKDLRAQRLLEPLVAASGRERPQALTLLGTRVLESIAAMSTFAESSDNAAAGFAEKLTTVACWNDEVFKEAFSGGKTAAVFAQALRRIPVSQVDEFCRALYACNLYWCAESLLLLSLDDIPSPVSRELEIATLCSVADRVRDPFQITVSQAHQALAVAPLGQALAEMSREELAQYARSDTPSSWFKTWLEWFCKPRAWGISEREISMLEEPDALLAWTAANAIKRGAPLSDAATDALICALRHKEKDVRWRAVYVLGSFPSRKACAALEAYAHDDEFRWVARSATRSLLEMLLMSERDDERDAIAAALRKFVLPSQEGQHRAALHELSRSVAITSHAKIERTFLAYSRLAGSALVEAQSAAAMN